MLSPILLADFYKLGHYAQYPKGISRVYTNWTPRTSRVPGQDHVVHFGLQYFIKDYLQRRFDTGFFCRPLAVVLAEYRKVVSACLGVAQPRTEHIEWLHDLGYLPIAIYSIPEGFSTPLGVPSVVIHNTRPEAFWLPNYLETMLSMVLWKPSTSATTAQRFRKICYKHATAFGHTDLSFIDWQCHDFSMRGMSGLEDAVLSGMGHLLSFSGTDTIPAILAARQYYGAELSTGGSVSATEHSVMCAGGKDCELETFERLITEVYPTGIVSIVSDTWDLWKVLTEFIPALKDKILARDGKVVIRPDSGDPVKIMIGDSSKPLLSPAGKGVLTCLAEALGSTNGLINKAAAIYGDSITEERLDAILQGLRDKGLSPYNALAGVGSYSYEYRTRDTYGFAMKATAVIRDGELIEIFKDPVTDDGGKRSHKGIPAVYQTDQSIDDNPEYYVYQGATQHQLENCELKKVYQDGKLLVEEDFATIRKRVRAWEGKGGGK